MSAVYRLLMLEDNGDEAMLIKHVLASSYLQFDILHISSGPEFISALATFNPDIVLSDHMIPGFSSAKALELARQKFKFIPFILVTGMVSEEFAASIIKAGADDYILKSNLTRLPTAIEQAIEKKQTEESLYQSEANLRSIFENSDTAFILVDDEFKIITANHLAESWIASGSKKTLVKGASLFYYSADEHSRRVRLVKNKILQGSPVQYEMSFHNSWYLFRFLPVRDKYTGKVTGASLAMSDITRRKKQDEDRRIIELQREFDKNNLRALINNTRDFIWSVDREMKIITSNDAFNKFMEAAFGKKIVKGIDILSVGLNDEQVAQYGSFYRRALLGESFLEVIHTTSVIEDFWSELSFYPIFKDDAVVGTACFSRNITPRMKAEQALITREEHYRALIEHNADAIVLNDEDAHMLYQSPSVSGMSGYGPEERKGKRVINYIHPDDKGYFIALYDKLKRSPGIPIPFAYRFRHKDGHYIWLEGLISNQLAERSVKAIIANYRDITPRKKTEEILALTLSRFEQAQKVAHMGHWHFDFAMERTEWSDGNFNVYGLSPGSVNPSVALFMEFVHPDDREKVQAIFERQVPSLKPTSFFHRIVLGDGSVRNLHNVSNFEFDENGNATGLYGISMDITELAEKEDALELLNNELETFIYKTYHDLRAPIASILGIIDLALRASITAEGREYFKIIGEITKKQSKMLKTLAMVMTARNKTVQWAFFNLQVLVDEVIAGLTSFPGRERITIKVSNGVHGDICSDRDLVCHILLHLLENAIQFQDHARAIPQIGITLSIRRTEQLKIRIEDNGIGISDEVKSRVFDMFFRGHAESKGSGLGLYLVSSAVIKLNGTMVLDTEEHKGSVFTITIPLDGSVFAENGKKQAAVINS